jgi:hypothetical protein
MFKYEFVKNEIENIGYTLLSTSYIGTNSKLIIKCDRGHTFLMNWTCFHNKKHRCLKCHLESKKLTIEHIKQKIEILDIGYNCTSNIYINNLEKLSFICNNNHEFKMSWANFNNGSRCPMCSKYCNNPTIEIIKQYVIELNIGYFCISDKYINAKSKLLFKCNKNHEFLMTWNNFRNRHRCPICNIENFNGKNNPNWKNGISFE